MCYQQIDSTPSDDYLLTAERYLAIGDMERALQALLIEVKELREVLRNSGLHGFWINEQRKQQLKEKLKCLKQSNPPQ